jgi:DNA-directed RNA polymerase specialized sigma subunit
VTDLYACQDQDSVDNKIDAENAIGRLNHIEKAILYLYVSGHTQSEIGAIFGYHQSTICRILNSMHKSA